MNVPIEIVEAFLVAALGLQAWTLKEVVELKVAVAELRLELNDEKEKNDAQDQMLGRPRIVPGARVGLQHKPNHGHV